jgi:uncharacterized membrane protein YqjE
MDRERVGSMAGRSVAQVMSDILGNVEEITRAEVQLVKAEFKEEAARGLSAAAIGGTGLVLALYAIGFLLVAAFIGLASVIPAWSAALLLALPLGVASAVSIGAGVKRLRTLSLRPEKTIDTVKENLEWLKHQAR